MSRPNFFIVGAAKAGTTTLWKYLRSHPEVFMPADENEKEPCFFTDLIEWGKDYDVYMALFAGANRKHRAIGEASGPYLTDPASAKLIYKYNPSARIITVLRNPADRAYSLYNWMVQEGYEYIPTFEKALREEENRVNKIIPNRWEPQYDYNYLYFHSGLYYEQIKRYLDWFNDKVMVLTFEDLIKDTQNTFDKVCKFLGISPHTVVPETANPSHIVYHAYIQFGLRWLTDSCVSAGLVRNETKKKRDWMLNIGVRRKKPPPMCPETRAALAARYRENILKTAKLLNRNLDTWLV